ncbi:MAG: hypothetical protein Q9227_008069 [Pyrenula ochraceoflavens]
MRAQLGTNSHRPISLFIARDPADLYQVGNCNELNAGYAADGYARVNGLGALVTTFGVGELSALNAVAGAYSEYVPLVHIVGQPSTLSQRDGMLLHHTLGNGNFQVFADMSTNISCAVAKLTDSYEAPMLIDHALRECWIHSRPVYITLPTDMVQKKVEGQQLKLPIDLTPPSVEREKEDYVVSVVMKYLSAAKNAVILVDACTIRHRVVEETRDLIAKSKLPTFVAPMGKGAVDETSPNYGGVYAGTGSNSGVAERVESADLVLSIGAIKSDFNTSGFTYKISQLNTIDFHSDYIRVKYSEYPGVGMKGVLRKVVDRLPQLNVQPGPTTNNNAIPKEILNSSDSTITHAWLWPRLGQWLQPNDVILTETGTSNFGIWETRFPKNVTAISQVLWGSIGYATGSCQGAALAVKELPKKFNRTILWTGDGSFQLTAQEISTCIRHDLNPIIFVICNDGYTIERFIHGMDATYNDVQNWRYKDLVAAFGADSNKCKTYQVKTREQFNSLLEDVKFSNPQHLQFVEVYMPKEDAPKVLQITAKASAENNAKM